MHVECRLDLRDHDLLSCYDIKKSGFSINRARRIASPSPQ